MHSTMVLKKAIALCVIMSMLAFVAFDVATKKQENSPLSNEPQPTPIKTTTHVP